MLLDFLMKVLSFNQLEDFNDCLESCSLTDISSSGGMWTSNNKIMGSRRIIGRLDRIVCNEEWTDALPSSYYQYLPPSTSDNSPVYLHFLNAYNSGSKIFRYFNYWAACDGFQ